MKHNELVIILVDDEDDLRSSIKLTLRIEGFQVHDFDNGEEAITFVQQLPSIKNTILISDILMPGLSGVELMRRIKAELPELPTIALTGYGDKPMVTELLRAGCDDFLEKPANAQELVETITRVFNHKQLLKETDHG